MFTSLGKSCFGYLFLRQSPFITYPENTGCIAVKDFFDADPGTGGGENSVLYGAGVVPAISRFTTVYKRMERVTEKISDS